MISVHQAGTNRRAFLRIGSLGLGGLSLAQMNALAETVGGRSLTKGKSVVFLFMHGGPPQTETFDPHMDAPAGIRSVVGEIPTTLPGITYGPTFARLAKLAHKTSIVRSFQPGDGKHDIKPIMGRKTLDANLGSLFSRIAGAVDPQTGMPTNAALFPRAVRPEAQARNLNFGKFSATGALGKAYAPFIPGTGALFDDMQMRLSKQRLDDRRHLLDTVDRFRRTADQTLTANTDPTAGLRRQAFDTILGGITDAFDLSQEDARTRARYDTAGLLRPDQVRTVWNNHKNYKDHIASLGHLMLLARRLAERGCGFITVTTNFVWDFHADKNNATVEEGLRYVGQPFDRAVSAFIEDCEDRGLSEDILLVCCGEMGRTPKLNKKGGRDHWGKLGPLLLYGAGVPRGHVVGKSSKDGGEPATEPVTLDHLIGTILHTLIDVPALRLETSFPADVVKRIAESKTIF